MLILKKIFQALRSQHLQKKDVHIGDRLFYYFLKFLSWMVILTFISLLVLIGIQSFPALQRFGLSFFVSSEWNSWTESFGALTLVWGTLVTSFLALVFAVPISLGVSLFLNELAPSWLAKPFNFILEMLAATPSIVYGLWGLFVLAPFIRDPIQKFLGDWFSFLPFFQGPHYGIGILCAGVVLAIMIIPTISSICKEVFRSIPHSHREAVLGIGATQWEMLKTAVLKGGQSGIIGACIMGLGRALGETMAVTMVIGNKPFIGFSIFEPAQTMASILANQYAEADSSLHLSALTAVGMTLFIISLIVNSCSVFLSWRTRKKFFNKGFV